ncbi:MAG: amidohydrolase [Gammaproteobacteria bacterium]
MFSDRYARRLYFALTLCLLTQGNAHAEEALAEEAMADAVYLNGSIYTVDGQNPWSEAVAIRDGRFIHVGSNEAVTKFIGPETERIDLEGKMAMPGLYDLHIHFIQGSEETTFGCRFSETATPTEIFATVRKCVDDDVQAITGWIVGGSWDASYLDQPERFNKSLLDEVAPDIPVLLWNNAHHDALANSEALALLGITADSTDPENGRIERLPDSTEPNGLLIETAAFEAGAQLPLLTKEQLAGAALQTQSRLNGFGVVGIKDAGTTSLALQTYKYLDDQDELTLRVATSILWQLSFFGPPEDTRAVVRDRHRYRGNKVGTDFVKIFLDGAPPGKTAAFLDPYVADEQHGADYRGYMIDSAQLTQDLIMLDAQGITVKMHAAGDASARAALDAVEATRKANGESGLFHEVSHASFIHPDDIPRFEQLGAAAEFSPVIWHPHPVLDYLGGFLDDGRVDRMWPIRSIVDTGALGIAGSDWPTVGADDPNPWPAIEAMVTRRHPTEGHPGVLGPEEALPLERVLEIYTINGATGIRQESETGSIETGKSADMIILDRNLFEIEPEDISETRVLKVILEGEVVHSS